MQTDGSQSRRKQLNPAKLKKTTNHSSIGNLNDDSTIALHTRSNSAALCTGTVFGPFPVMKRAKDGKTVTKVQDVNGQFHLFSIDDSARRWLMKLKFVNNPDAANCTLRYDEFVCSRCQLASFSNEQNLVAHQTYYCKQSSSEGNEHSNSQSPSSAPSLIPMINAGIDNLRSQSKTSPPVIMPSNAILLPVAHNLRPDAPQMQMIGLPQVLIPVAVPINSDSNAIVQPIILEHALIDGVRLPATTGIPIGGAVPINAHTFYLPLSIRPSSKVGISISNKRPKMPIADAKPLDLSKPSPSTSRKDRSPKPFICECGIAFSRVKTLDGHKNYYCKANESVETSRPMEVDVGASASSNIIEDASGDESRFRTISTKNDLKPSLILKCYYCEFTGSSATLLSHHLRSAHSAIQGYLCKLCGYKGYSIRGMKSHMRSHDILPTNSHNRLDELILSYVTTMASITNGHRSSESDETMTTSKKSRLESLGFSEPSGYRRSRTVSILCQQCQITFESTSEYDQHCCVKMGAILLHPNTDPFEDDQSKLCPFCSFSSFSTGNMKHHLQFAHTIGENNG